VELKQPSRSDELVQGADVILKCVVDGNTEPTVDWYRNHDRSVLLGLHTGFSFSQMILMTL